MLHFVYFEDLSNEIYTNLILIGIAEFLATLFSKVIISKLNRKTSLMLCNLFIAACFFFLLIFKLNLSSRYTVTLLTRAALPIMFIILQIVTLEQLPTEVRAFGNGFCMSLGVTGGIGLPYIKELNSELIVILILLFVSSTLGINFLRETKNEYALRNL